jgi:hypothetical protein
MKNFIIYQNSSEHKANILMAIDRKEALIHAFWSIALKPHKRRKNHVTVINPVNNKVYAIHFSELLTIQELSNIKN